jgi:signal peptidase I
MAILPQSIRSLFDLSGTASRMRGWIILGLSLLALILAELLRYRPDTWSSIGFLVAGITFIMLIVMLVQRLHDAGRSGYWSLLAIIPLVGLVATIVILLLSPREVPRTGHALARRIGGVALLVLALLFMSRAVYWQPYWIPSENMKPTLLVGDFIIATRVRSDDLQRGDVIVFRHPINGTDYIKRVIGLPGDKVQMVSGALFIDGEAVPQVPDGTFEEVFERQGPMGTTPRCENGVLPLGSLCTKSRFIETLPGGRPHAVLNIDADGPADTTDVFTVPGGMYFVMGDNRDNSNDSRFSVTVGGVGFVPAENIKSRARWVLFSSGGRWIADVTSWRSDRYLQVIE